MNDYFDDAQPSSKRRRHACSTQLVFDIHQAITPSQRISVISNAVDNVLCHDDTIAHDESIQGGVANALCLKLGYVVQIQKNASNRTNISNCESGAKEEENDILICKICTALQLIYTGCSDSVREFSFEGIGNELLPLLTNVIENQLHLHNNRRNNILPENARNNRSLAVQKCISVLYSLSRVKSATISMVKGDGSSVINTLMRLLTVATCFTPNDDNYCEISSNAVVEVIETIRNLSHSFCHLEKGDPSENNIRIIFFDLLLNIFSKFDSERVRRCAVEGILDLSTDSDKNVMPRTALGSILFIAFNTMIENGSSNICWNKNYLLGDLFKEIDKMFQFKRSDAATYLNSAVTADIRSLQSQSGSSDKGGGSNLDLNCALFESAADVVTNNDDICVRYHATASLYKAIGRAKTMVERNESSVLDTLLGVITDDNDTGVRQLAAKGVRLLASEDTGGFMVSHPGLFDTLVHVSRHNKDDTKLQAVQAIATLAERIDDSHQRWEEMLRVLVDLIYSNNRYCAEVAVKTIFLKTKNAGSRIHVASHPGLLEALATVAPDSCSTRSAKEYAVNALLNLASNEGNGEIMANRSVIASLVEVSTVSGVGRDGIRKSAIETLLKLSKLVTNRRFMAKQVGLLSSLIRYARTVENDGTRNAVKETIMKLVPAM